MQFGRLPDVVNAGESFLLLPEVMHQQSFAWLITVQIRSQCPWPIQICGGELREAVPAGQEYPFLVSGGELTGLDNGVSLDVITRHSTDVFHSNDGQQ